MLVSDHSTLNNCIMVMISIEIEFGLLLWRGKLICTQVFTFLGIKRTESTSLAVFTPSLLENFTYNYLPERQMQQFFSVYEVSIISRPTYFFIGAVKMYFTVHWSAVQCFLTLCFYVKNVQCIFLIDTCRMDEFRLRTVRPQTNAPPRKLNRMSSCSSTRSRHQ